MRAVKLNVRSQAQSFDSLLEIPVGFRLPSSLFMLPHSMLLSSLQLFDTIVSLFLGCFLRSGERLLLVSQDLRVGTVGLLEEVILLSPEVLLSILLVAHVSPLRVPTPPINNSGAYG